MSVSTAVVDAGGHLLALARMDKASWLTAGAAHALAYTSAGFRPLRRVDPPPPAEPCLLLCIEREEFEGGR